ncbi:MAG: NAD(P)H-dependent oxidoreductase [Bacteroidia bacterium]|nr:NAD(P)H-dependent oxidoreductase [Bacteroidia bacterium]
MKTLIVSYLPSLEDSSTKKILDAFTSSIKNSTIEYLDLLKNPPSFFMADSLAAYRMRNYGGVKLNKEQETSIASIDSMCQQLKSADIVVLAYPMHNFGMPGIIKTYFDAVLQHGETFKYGAKGPEGLMKGKKALTIYTSGGGYSADKATHEYPNWDTLTVLSKIEFSFMGYSEIEIIGAQGTLNASPGYKEKAIADASEKVKKIAEKWNL